MASWAVSTLPTFITQSWAHRATANAVTTGETRRSPYQEPNRHYHRTSSEVLNSMSGLFPDGPVDLLRDQVRRVVFRVYQQSATPISTLMIQDLTEEEAIQILIDYHTACDTCDGLQARTDWSRTEEYKQISPHFAKLWDIVEQYRQKYAERLREANLVDVHIEYEYGTYNPPVFREDAAHIMNSGGRIYHLWPHHENDIQDAPPKAMGFCTVLKPEVLAKLINGRSDIDVTVITAPATLGEFDIEISPRLKAGKMFPYHIPSLSEVPLHRLPAERQKEIRQKIDEICSNRPRSASLENIRKMPKGRHSWHTYSTSFHHDGPQPKWSPNTQPFSKDMRSASNHAWWLEYLPEHHERIEGLRSQMAVEQGIPAPDRCALLALPEPAMAYGEHSRETQRLERSNAELADKLVEAAALTKDVEFTQSRLRHRPGDEEMMDRLKLVQSNLDQLTERVQALKIDVACLQDRLDYGAMDTAVDDVESDIEINGQQKDGRSDSATAPSLIEGQAWPAVAAAVTKRGSQRHSLLTGTRPRLERQSSQGAVSFDQAAGEMAFSVAPASSLIAAMLCNRFRRNSGQVTMPLQDEQDDTHHPLPRSEEETAGTAGPAAELQRAEGTHTAGSFPQDHGAMADTPHPTTGYLDRVAEDMPLGRRRIRFADLPNPARCIGPRDRRDDQMWQGMTAPTPAMPVTPSDWLANKTNKPAGRQVTFAVSNVDQDQAFSDSLRAQKPGADRKKASTAELSLSRCDATPIDIPDINFDIPEPEPGCYSLGFLQFNASVDEAESLLNTKYNVYQHSDTKQPHVACEEYSIPAHLAEHVDFITPTVHFDAMVKRNDKREPLDKRIITPGIEKGLCMPNSPSLPKLGASVDGADIQKRLKYCNKQITPDCLRALYEFQHGHLALKKNAYGIVEYAPQAYVPADLDKFFRMFAQKAVGERPILDSIDGGVVQQTNMSFGFNGESDLDLEYAMSLVYPQNVVLYQVGDLVEGASFDNFLDAIDGSYCTFRGGDSKQQDATYPDPFPGNGSYQGPQNCGGFAATKVISTSYGYNEHDLSPFYERRQCAEYLKLGLMGVSVLYSSGDYGVAGNGGQCIAADGTYNNGHSGRFNPAFPSTCPWVTSVGATQVKPHISLPNAIASGTEPEKACETVIFSGGGFSNVFPLPGYQSKAVKSFFTNYPPPYTSAQYNNSQVTRGYPDISANGANYVVAVDGQFSLVYGTSASSPTLGSILTLINEERFAKGLSSIGFVNPVAYKHPDVFNDITAGSNPGCGTDGFQAVPGWDPLTGLGTPNYPKMLKLWLSLG